MAIMRRREGTAEVVPKLKERYDAVATIKDTEGLVYTVCIRVNRTSGKITVTICCGNLVTRFWSLRENSKDGRIYLAAPAFRGDDDWIDIAYMISHKFLLDVEELVYKECEKLGVFD